MTTDSFVKYCSRGAAHVTAHVTAFLNYMPAAMGTLQNLEH